MQNQKIALVFWGRRGGGEVLTNQLQSAASKIGLEAKVFVRPKIGPEQIGSLNILAWLAARRKLIQDCARDNVSTVIFVMASPWDIFLDLRLKKANIQAVRIIHDARPHPGEVFPPKIWTRLVVRSATEIIVLSKYVAAQLVADNPNIVRKFKVGKLPPPPIAMDVSSNVTTDNAVLLFAGRGKKYKGQELLQKAWPMIGDSKSRLIIAGLGHSDSHSDPRTDYRIGWLADSELENLIRQSTIVLLPYIEASQSGLIPLAQSLGKPVVITPAGGLSEQIINNISGIVARDLSPEAFAEAANKALTKKWSIPELDETQSSIELLKLCLINS